MTSRPLAGERSGLGGHGDTSAGAPRGEVTVDDAALFTARFDGGAIGSFEASRFALGRKNAFRVEINGTDGSVAFDFEDNNVLEFFDGRNPVAEQGFRRILVTEPEHPYVSAWWPPGHGLGYEHGFTHQVVDLVTALAEGGSRPRPSTTGCRCSRSWPPSRPAPAAPRPGPRSDLFAAGPQPPEVAPQLPQT